MPAEVSDAAVAFRMKLNAFVIAQCVFCGRFDVDNGGAKNHRNTCSDCEERSNGREVAHDGKRLERTILHEPDPVKELPLSFTKPAGA